MKLILKTFFLSAVLFAACAAPKQTRNVSKTGINQNISTDSTYGYTQGNPIKVGGGDAGPLREREYLNNLKGPNGESINYTRKGSCCPFKTKNGFMGGGMLDIYIITWEKQKAPVTLYINMYDKDKLKAPVGFTTRRAF